MPTPAISKERAESLLGPYLPAFGRCLLAAEEDWLSMVTAEARKDLTATLKARFYWERANHHTRTAFVGEETRLFSYCGIPFVEIGDEAWIRFKKMHGADKSTVGYPTVQRQTFESQGHLGWEALEIPFPWGGARPMLVCGYVLDGFGRIGALYVAYPNGPKNAYDIPISLGEATAFKMPSAAPRTPTVLTTLPDVRRRAE
jgi:hypothetical protein